MRGDWALGLVLVAAAAAQATTVTFSDPPGDTETPTAAFGPLFPSDQLDLLGGTIAAEAETLVVSLGLSRGPSDPTKLCEGCARLLVWDVGDAVYAMGSIYAAPTSDPLTDAPTFPRYVLVRVSGASPEGAVLAGVEAQVEPDGLLLWIPKSTLLEETGSLTITRPRAEAWHYSTAAGTRWDLVDRAPDCAPSEDGACTAFAPTFVGTPPGAEDVFLASARFDLREPADVRALTLPIPEGGWDLVVNATFERTDATSADRIPALVVRDDAGTERGRFDGRNATATARYPATGGTWRAVVEGDGPWVVAVEAVASPALARAQAPPEEAARPGLPAWALPTLGALALAGLAAVVVIFLLRRQGGASRYQHVRDLAAGAFGRTWLAHDTRLKRRVVVKELHAAARADAQTRALLLREAQVVAKISHPNVVTLYDVELEGAAPRIVMEYVEGGSLAERLARGPMSPLEASRLADELLAALERVHAEGVVHRDIKPANVLFTKDGAAKLVDFGIARAPDSAETVAQTGGITGTPLYMAPEQVLGEKADARTDLYALAALLHEVVTGAAVVGRPSSLAALQRAIVEEAPHVSPEMPAPLREPIVRALAKRPEDRYQSAREMREALRIAMLAPAEA